MTSRFGVCAYWCVLGCSLVGSSPADSQTCPGPAAECSPPPPGFTAAAVLPCSPGALCGDPPPGCGTPCNGLSAECFVGPETTVELCSADASSVELRTSTALYCCQECLAGPGLSCGNHWETSERSLECIGAQTGSRSLGTCGVGVCERAETCVAGEAPSCEAGPPAVEVCGNGLDDDCDGGADCDDPDDDCFGWTYEVCSPQDERGAFGDDHDCDDNAGLADDDCSGGPEICGDGQDNDSDPNTSDTDLTKCTSPETDPEGEGDLEDDCSESCGSCDGKPVHLVKRQAYVGPHEDVRIAGAQGPSFDLSFSRTWDSERANADHIDDMAAGQPRSSRTHACSGRAGATTSTCG